MRRIEPALPDLLPLSFQYGPSAGEAGEAAFDPVELRLPRSPASTQHRQRDRSILRRPTRLLIHSGTVRNERDHLEKLVAGGYGLLVFLDGPLVPADLPAPVLDGQIVTVASRMPSLWGVAAEPDYAAWRRAGIPVGLLLGLAPAPDSFDYVRESVAAAHAAGAVFVVGTPVVVSAERRHEVYDQRGGEDGDRDLENLLFHCDLVEHVRELERETCRCCRAVSLSESLPGPATATVPADTFAAGAALLLWARRLDLLDGVSSMGWQLRRAAHALLAAGRSLAELLAEDNIRIVPGFTPWVEAFARAAWSGDGAPFGDTLERWISS